VNGTVRKNRARERDVSAAIGLDRDDGFDSREMLARLESAWQRSDEIFALIAPDALYERPITLRQPFIFYVGHLPAFAWNQILRGLLGREGPEPELDELFARGIDPVGVDRYEPDRAEMWPAPERVTRYRDRVRDAVRDSFDEVAALASADVLAERGRIYRLVIEHELMHHETLLYMVHQLEREKVRKPSRLPAYRSSGAAPSGRVCVEGRDVPLGESFEHLPFGWDNEFPEHVEPVESFDIDRTPVRNREWLEFMDGEGYQRRELWDAESWAWRERVQHDHPAFWVRRAGEWTYRTLFDELPLHQVGDWPVYVSWAEAAAYAKWRGGALPTEAEFHAAADASLGTRDWSAVSGNFDFANWAPVPVGSSAGGAVADLVGNGWEWTRTRFAPFPGFNAWARTYPGYSADFFDEHHYVMLGASFATDRTLVRRSFRNWFQPHYPFVYAKFRCVWR
jgi:ergothioneine biosynthesis protein EgtB